MEAVELPSLIVSALFQSLWIPNIGVTNMLTVAFPWRLATALYSEEQADSARRVLTAPVKLTSFLKFIVSHQLLKTDIRASAANLRFVPTADLRCPNWTTGCLAQKCSQVDQRVTRRVILQVQLGQKPQVSLAQDFAPIRNWPLYAVHARCWCSARNVLCAYA